jgi:hypothetical protein
MADSWLRGGGVLVVQCNDEVAGWITLVRFPVELGTSSTLSVNISEFKDDN